MQALSRCAIRDKKVGNVSSSESLQVVYPRLSVRLVSVRLSSNLEPRVGRSYAASDYFILQ